MKLSLGLRVSNSLSLTPQLQQAIRLLQLSNLELEQEVQLQLESNPLLERIELESSDQQVEVHEQSNQELSDAINSDFIPDELPVDTQWDDIYTHQPTTLGAADFEEREDNRVTHTSLKQHVENQVNLLNFSKIDRLIAFCIIDALDDKGFLTETLDEIAEAVNKLLLQADLEYECVEEHEVLVVLKYIQQLDPIGIGSRGLIEHLMIQLENMSYSTILELNARKVLNHYQFLVHNDLNKLLKATALKADELKQTLVFIKTLKPYPGIDFEESETEYQIPDVVILREDGVWRVKLNPDILPKLRINSFYSGMIKRADQSDDNQYIKNQMLEAKNFIKSIDERHKTLLKVATCIAKHQKSFLEQGAEAMKPLVLRDVADEVELHESTVSRVTTNKYVLTPKGLFELKYFFSSHVGTSEGGECSSTAIRAMIKKIIAAENPCKPLSDNTIANLLKEEGIDVARRTVAKYRESLRISSSSERKVII
ncbi:RNA polymerase factor sigma-54 [Acinetobacter boissieri]|uniref:RNA polymerase sigma-54 factor n=1 Tax=Acinetobacter boissieri TaxID=1219383 RepID=A0A1G6J5V3_9GAMM|nr:RNA polymerase factor sigma-54 [Acinetobacter boissieri]SDC13346.1 RNA polymerase, sigma 54 subunit, RpoN/SigL [Acinetobacter boissieri]